MRRLAQFAAAALASTLALVLAPAAHAEKGGDAGAAAAKAYTIDTSGSTKELKAGGQGKLVLAIVPVGKTHVHPQAPLKISLAPKGLVLAKDKLGHKDALDPAAEGPRFEVPFTAGAAGPAAVDAKVDFFICSDEWCVKQVKDVTVPVAVK